MNYRNDSWNGIFFISTHTCSPCASTFPIPNIFTLFGFIAVVLILSPASIVYSQSCSVIHEVYWVLAKFYRTLNKWQPRIVMTKMIRWMDGGRGSLSLTAAPLIPQSDAQERLLIRIDNFDGHLLRATDRELYIFTQSDIIGDIFVWFKPIVTCLGT